MADSVQVKGIKDYIVKAHRAGACTKDGGHIPREKMGRVGKGVAYHLDHVTSPAFQRNHVRIFGH